MRFQLSLPNPFGNSMVPMTLTDVQIDTLLEQQFRDDGTGYWNMLQPSAKFSYIWDSATPLGDKVDATNIRIDNAVVEPDGRYRGTVNSYLAGGGSGFSVLEEGTDRVGGEIDVDSLVAYFASAGTVAPGPAYPAQQTSAMLPAFMNHHASRLGQLTYPSGNELRKSVISSFACCLFTMAPSRCPTQ